MNTGCLVFVSHVVLTFQKRGEDKDLPIPLSAPLHKLDDNLNINTVDEMLQVNAKYLKLHLIQIFEKF